MDILYSSSPTSKNAWDTLYKMYGREDKVKIVKLQRLRYYIKNERFRRRIADEGWNINFMHREDDKDQETMCMMFTLQAMTSTTDESKTGKPHGSLFK